ncbi:1-acyl-sn-glycerol-3-phosphate acyltransferase [Thermocatellispora tengchongensis]|uniref:1-acyl-sn-glycerol-3-phosphate acyltransferase n=1 Tax=Thermocatellispora tengchongensis TaxID=1073253 RepID=A0A840P3S7_9ACTN|nr:lysophospholipid acyltransferase family protein [Thermocatellispora tengchongensis]MBB5132521.1 1-acyl-sn-glycerol-3-phosphate acyltransferase [Thermocatellispora tengchongensis]
MSRPERPPWFWEAVAVAICKPLMLLLTKRDWRGGEHLPRKGGIIIVTNHLSWTDPVLLSHFLYDNGRWPVFLAKAGVFRAPAVGKIIRWLRTIPVYRGSTEAGKSLAAAERGIRDGAAVIFYPEGTVTRDPDLWPMTGKTGAARLALATGAPVIPIAHWGAHELLPYGSKKPNLFPRKTFHVKAGPPVDLSKYAGPPVTAEVLRDATADIIAAITALLADIRGEKPPETPYPATPRIDPAADPGDGVEKSAEA